MNSDPLPTPSRDGITASFDLDLLCCPDCRRAFAFTPCDIGNEQQPRYGVLTCKCFRYPVVDGVPIIVKGHVGLLSFVSGQVESRGPDVEEVTQLVSEGRGFKRWSVVWPSLRDSRSSIVCRAGGYGTRA